MAAKAYIVCAIFILLLTSIPRITQSKPTERPFGFLKSLEGSTKGQKVDGLHQLKSYLAKFGYLENQAVSKNTTSINDEKDELFDEKLEKAVKTYQRNYRLRVTGHLDAATIRQMMKPRCGCPDIINGRNTMLRKKDKRSSYNIKKSMNETSLYVYAGTTWPSSRYILKYEILRDTIVPGAEDMQTAVSDALFKWQQHSPFTFWEAGKTDFPDLVFGFSKTDRGDGTPFDGPRGILAFSSYPTAGKSYYDATEKWSADPGQDEFDLPTVVLHEVGHLLGLAHSSDPSALMYATISPGEKKRGLQQDDIQGIEALYSFKISGRT